jgi:hypothetical protein
MDNEGFYRRLLNLSGNSYRRHVGVMIASNLNLDVEEEILCRRKRYALRKRCAELAPKELEEQTKKVL